MSIIDNAMYRLGITTRAKFKELVGEAVKRELEKMPYWLDGTPEAERNNLPDPIIFANQADMYRLSPILGTALDILAGDVGLSKLNVKRMVGEETRDIPNHEFEVLMRNPNPLESGMEFLGNTIRGYKLNGNHIWWLNRPDKYTPPTEIWQIPYQKIQPVPDGRMFLKGYVYFPGDGGEPIPLPTWQVVHFKNFNPSSPYWGLSIMESLAETIRGDLGMRRTVSRTYNNYQGMPPSILAFKDWVSDEAWKDIKAEKQNAVMKNEMMMLRGTGDTVSWMSRAMSSKDMDFIATLKQNTTDIFNRTCPGLLAMLSENATEANALAARATYAEKTLWQSLELLAQKTTGEILPAYGRKLVCVFDDPRVVDRKLKLEEQAAYERSHTLGETRREFYQDDPLGDERDNKLMSEAKSAPVEVKPQPAPESAPVQSQETSDMDEATKAAIDDMMRWRRMTLRGKEKAGEFRSAYIPAGVLRSVKAKLPSILDDKAEIAKLFDVEIEKLKPQQSAAGILRGIELGVKALEQVTR